MDANKIEYGHLLRLRLAVARFGEMDLARWWNTKGVLGKLGEMALKRGFPRSHFFAQARVVFAVAADRCREVFDPPEAVTLWNLPAEVEDEFDSCWAGWTEAADQWADFFQRLQSVKGPDLLAVLNDLGVVTPDEIESARKLRREAENRALRVPDAKSLDRLTVSLLAAGFFRGEPGEPAIPYARIGKA